MANNQWSLDKMTKHIEQNMLSLGTGQDTKTDKSIGKIPNGLWPLVNCPNQSTCIAHFDLYICIS